MAINDSTFTIYRTDNCTKIPQKAIRVSIYHAWYAEVSLWIYFGQGGSVILLFHIKQESYVAGKGSILTDSLPDAVKEEIISEGIYLLYYNILILVVIVGGRKRESSHGIQKAPPLSGDCFWQLEKSEDPLSGNVLS